MLLCAACCFIRIQWRNGSVDHCCTIQSHAMQNKGRKDDLLASKQETFREYLFTCLQLGGRSIQGRPSASVEVASLTRTMCIDCSVIFISFVIVRTTWLEIIDCWRWKIRRKTNKLLSIARLFFTVYINVQDLNKFKDNGNTDARRQIRALGPHGQTVHEVQVLGIALRTSEEQQREHRSAMLLSL